nr:immunoglobulin light chain junction region [Macaca mulatta]MOX10457.1 immunoglobulin light chain junction region [Macaca mulatta]
CVQAIAHPWTF